MASVKITSRPLIRCSFLEVIHKDVSTEKLLEIHIVMDRLIAFLQHCELSTRHQLLK